MMRLVRKGDVVKPQAVVLDRVELHPGRDWTPQQNTHAPVSMEVESAPLPVNYTAFAGIGKVDQAHWRRTVLAIADKLSIRASEVNGSATMGKAEPGSVVVARGVNPGKLPIRERTTIEQPAQTTYGALSILRPDPTFAPQYLKLM